MRTSPISNDVYTDFSHLTSLKTAARLNSSAALDKVANQFESLFTQILLKRMREASFGGSILDSTQSEFFRDLYDKQLAIHLSDSSGLGFAEQLVRQLSSKPGVSGVAKTLDDYRSNPFRSLIQSKISVGAFTNSVKNGIPDQGDCCGSLFESKEQFVRALKPFATRAAKELGVHPGVLLAQAALESGWGKKAIRHTGGKDSHNLFGIKADSGWAGESAVVPTLEYESGIARRYQAKFRSYEGYAESFQDYVHFIQSNPRYREALRTAEDPRAYIESLQRAGYATDPNYAGKIMRIFEQKGLGNIGFKSAES